MTIVAIVLFVYAALVVVCRLSNREPHLATICAAVDALEATARGIVRIAKWFHDWMVRVSAFLRAGVDQYRVMKRRGKSEHGDSLERLVGL